VVGVLQGVLPMWLVVTSAISAHQSPIWNILLH